MGAAVVGGILVVASRASAAEPAPPDDGPDFDADAESQLAMNYYAQALTNPIMWSAGQLKSLAGLLGELGFTTESANINDMGAGLYADYTTAAPAPLPDISFIPPSEIDAIADQNDQDLAELGDTANA